jgi:hypothetical protein
MRRNAFDERRDLAIADEVGADRAMMCMARGCPNVWATDFGQRLCSAHRAADPSDWPRVTHEQQEAQTERAYRAQFPAEPKPVRHLSREEKLAVLQRMRTMLRAGQQPRAWIARLLARQANGEKLSPAQRDALAQASRNAVCAGADE